jgi:hypothetical protein
LVTAGMVEHKFVTVNGLGWLTQDDIEVYAACFLAQLPRTP